MEWVQASLKEGPSLTPSSEGLWKELEAWVLDKLHELGKHPRVSC